MCAMDLVRHEQYAIRLECVSSRRMSRMNNKNNSDLFVTHGTDLIAHLNSDEYTYQDDIQKDERSVT